MGYYQLDPGWMRRYCYNIQFSEIPAHTNSRLETGVDMSQKISDLDHDGGQATEQGDCSRFKGNIPHCCKKTPTIFDLLPDTLTTNKLQIVTKGRSDKFLGPRSTECSKFVSVNRSPSIFLNSSRIGKKNFLLSLLSLH